MKTGKGEVQTDILGVKMTCDGAYWDWPWWKRALSMLVFKPYGHFGAIKATMWKFRHQGSFNHLPHPMPWRFFYATVYSMYSSKARPIYWEIDSESLKRAVGR